MAKVPKRPPTDKLLYRKRKEKLPLQTWEEIERNIARGGLTKAEIREQWESLFLDRTQVAEVLEFVQSKQTRSVYFCPVVVFAAHTGARLSEIMRSRVEDFKFEDEEVVLREKKKKRGTATFRRVPMSALLRQTMLD
jgi:integrase